MKGSNDISATGTTPTGAPSSDGSQRNPPSRPVDGFALGGVSDLPDPATHAYRKDLADTALAGRVIASHYAEPLIRHIVADAPFHAAPANDSDRIGMLRSGEEIRMLDLSRGWAWGYAPDGRVGYIPAEAVGV